jgi:hypothetical protein
MQALSTVTPLRQAMPPPALPAAPLPFTTPELRSEAGIHRGVERCNRDLARIDAMLADLAVMPAVATTEVSYTTPGVREPLAIPLPVALVRAGLLRRRADTEALLARFHATAAARDAEG